MSNLGFVGLGIMGKPMALNLIKGGHTLHLNSRSGVPAELTAAGGVACDSPKAVAQATQVQIRVPEEVRPPGCIDQALDRRRAKD
jgi:2-hydroxy-3-oxopropionate reductase